MGLSPTANIRDLSLFIQNHRCEPKNYQDPIQVLENIEREAQEYVRHKLRMGKRVRESFGGDYENIRDKLSKYVHVKNTPSRFRTLMEKFKDIRSSKEYMLVKTFMLYHTDDKSLGLIRKEMKEFEEYVEKLAEVLETKLLPKLIELYERLKDKL